MAVERRTRHLGFGGYVRELQLASAIPGEDDEGGGEDPSPRRRIRFDGGASSHDRVLYIYRSKCHTSAVSGRGVDSK
ncbi:hypothetical protein MGALJ_33270 [Mycobacterium gallinarum]|uniref:Uncharacterized protein n=1 Tax=Mycobacterium gallinarum TaxID=39689 RepID=A0A9W4B428_9MYCO|nr:hypothetical protein MGALJ_33270 [Mycobacterium gallinarum]